MSRIVPSLRYSVIGTAAAADMALALLPAHSRVGPLLNPSKIHKAGGIVLTQFEIFGDGHRSGCGRGIGALASREA